MNPFEHATEIATRMREQIQTEIAVAREQRVLVRTLDVQGLFERARARGEFNLLLARYQNELTQGLAAIGQMEGGGAISLESLRKSSEPGSGGLADALGELRSAAQALHEIDALNQVLSRRALACVRGFISALSPRADAYDRMGGAQASGGLSITRQVA